MKGPSLWLKRTWLAVYRPTDLDLSSSLPIAHTEQRAMPPTITQHMDYIQEKMNPIMEAMVTALLIKCPDDPAEFMMKWLLEQERYDRGEFGKPVDEAELAKLRTEVEKLKADKAKLVEATGA
mmetsp:Transcript_55737/g.100266  ORF Transcript_55737/g.100266 Transcript_55737/m.100266 type:complete len:123 (-) Transcript_55737:75-443(-)